MKELTCLECHAKFQVRYLDLPDQSGYCPTCQLNNEIENAKKDIHRINLKLQSIIPTIQDLKQAKDIAAATYYEAKDNWSSMVNLYEKLDRKANLIQHELDIKLKQKSTTPKKTKPRKKAKSPEDAALEALKALSPEMQAAIIGKLQTKKQF